MLYSGKGDDGKTNLFGCDQRISKSSVITEALGALDEINSFLGICKVKSKEIGFAEIVNLIQQNLFTIQAEVAGAQKNIKKEKIDEIEEEIGRVEKELPPVKTFFVSGGTELSASFDFARTIARRAERRVIKVSEEEKVSISKETLIYLNRLSSLLFALARLSNLKSGINDESPKY